MSWVITPRSSTWAEGGDLVYTIVVGGITYRVHEFKTVGTTSLYVLNSGNVEYLVVAGGGVGGAYKDSVGGGGGGGGGAGSSNSVVGGNGGSGIVIVRYAI
jgi:hypothetical protein